jgi:hypothetical protein
VNYEEPSGKVLQVFNEFLELQPNLSYDDMARKPRFAKKVLKELNAEGKKKNFKESDIEEVLDYVLQFCLSEGTIPDTLHVKQIENLGDNCYEFKSGNLRLGGFYIEPDLFIIQTFKKGTKNQQRFIESIKKTSRNTNAKE